MHKRVIENDETTIEVGAHVSSMAPGQIVDKLFIACILEGDNKAAQQLLNDLASRYEKRPLQNWLEGSLD
jgi:hypothetical protein